MEKTVTVVRHTQQKEYGWEVQIPDAPLARFKEQHLGAALDLLGLQGKPEVREELLALQNGESRSYTTEVNAQDEASLRKLKDLPL